jgi:hypothetical protein
MKKSKFIIMTLAVLFAVGAAFTAKPHQPSTIYYISGTQYFPVGTMGLNYTCTTPSSNNCTYTYSMGVYTPYITDAQYTPLGYKQDTSKRAKK